MRMILAAAAMAAAVGAAGVASATTFAGNYSVAGYWNSDNGGLNIDVTNASGGFNITNLNIGGSQTFTLFEIAAGETVNVPDPWYNLSDDDATAHNIHVDFTFSLPTNFPGGGPDTTVNGVTVGVGGNNDYGQLTWNGPASVNFGSFGVLTITMLPVNFNTASQEYNRHDDWDEESGKTKVKATFALSGPTGGAVPEPATWGLMITGFGMAGGMLRRRRTAALAA
jgi:hypothetical protein